MTAAIGLLILVLIWMKWKEQDQQWHEDWGGCCGCLMAFVVVLMGLLIVTAL